jgi:hypothetical protein
VTPSRDLGILVGLAVALAVGTLAVSSRERPAGPPYRLDGHGALGLSGLGAGLEAAGQDVHSGRRATIGTEGLVVVVEPADFSQDEAASWRRSVERGAVLLLATSRRDALTDALGLRLAGAVGGPWLTAAGYRAFPDALPPAFPPAASFAAVPPGAEPLAKIGVRPAFVVFPLGRGSVWAISDPRWLSNAGVQGTGLPIALALASMAGGPVTVDEFHHGRGLGGGSFGYLPPSLQLVILQLAIVALAALTTLGRRLGPVPPAREPQTRSTAELARSLALMHRSAGRLEAATAPLAAAVRHSLGGFESQAADGLARLDGARSERDALAAWSVIEQTTRRVTGANR